MARYEFSTPEELIEMIKATEQFVGNPEQAIGNSTQGNLQYKTRIDAEAGLRDLYRAYYRKTGQTNRLKEFSNAPRIVPMTGRREF